MGNATYFRTYMPDSPKGREIDRLEGDPAAIIARGAAIEELGERMRRAAETLRLLADDQVGRGESLDAVREQAGEVHADLRTAGQRYAPSGAALRAYGETVGDVQASLDAAARRCEELWETVRARASAVDDAGEVPDAADGSTSAREEAEAQANRALDAAEQEWLDAAVRFDGFFDTWDEAYERAIGGLEQATADGVTDDLWDDALPFLDGLVEVLEVVGVVLLVAALVVGGPLVGLLATVAALITLIATGILWAKGRKSDTDLGLAILGVIPFGKLGRVFAAASEGSAVARFAGSAKYFVGADDFAALRTHAGAISARAGQDWAAGGYMVSWAQASVVSQMVQETATGWRYVRETVRFSTTSDVFLGRLWGVGDSVGQALDSGTVGLVDVAFGTKTPWAQAVLLADTVTGELAESADDRLVDSWR
ncbi:hypothetical protein [Agromyces arachidis]|uniref:hypothetical protein n=1 Tax=Agromyces arachidis TaxID=766966 RepID=UPI004055C910